MSNRTNGVTAITAGVLALLGGTVSASSSMVWAVRAIIMFAYAVAETPDRLVTLSKLITVVLVSVAGPALAAVLLVLGGVLLLARRPVGRAFVAVGGGVVIVTSAVGWCLVRTETQDVLVSTALSVLTVVLALARSTRRWCRPAEPESTAPRL